MNALLMAFSPYPKISLKPWCSCTRVSHIHEALLLVTSVRKIPNVLYAVRAFRRWLGGIILKEDMSICTDPSHEVTSPLIFRCVELSPRPKLRRNLPATLQEQGIGLIEKRFLNLLRNRAIAQDQEINVRMHGHPVGPHIVTRCRPKHPDLGEILTESFGKERTISNHAVTLAFIEMH